MTENGTERTEIQEKEQSKVLGDDRKEKGRRRMANLRQKFTYLPSKNINEMKERGGSS